MKFILFIPIAFVLGWVGSSTIHKTKVSPDDSLPSGCSVDGRTDVIRTSSSSTTRRNIEEQALEEEMSSSLNANSNGKSEAFIRGVPFPLLKRIYLERQDADWKKAHARYENIPVADEEAKKKQEEELFTLFKKNHTGPSHYSASGEWNLRGGKMIPYKILFRLYSQRSTVGESGVFGADFPDRTTGDVNLATRGSEICFMAFVYFKVSDTPGAQYASDGTGSCLQWAGIRKNRPFVIFESYNSMEFEPYFDRISVPYPAFGTDSVMNPEWYDSHTGAWSTLSRVSWEPLSLEEFKQAEADLNAEMIKSK